MSTSTLVLRGYKTLRASRIPGASDEYLRAVGDAVVDTFRRGMRGKKGGRYYGGHRASAAGEYPANRSGALSASVRRTVGGDKVVVSAGAHYAKYLAGGTSKMAKRKMLEEAMKETLRPSIRKFVGFHYA